MADDEETRDAAAPARRRRRRRADAPPAAADDGEGALDAAGAARLAAHDPALTWAHDVISAGPGDNADACCRVLGKYLGEPAGLKIADASLRGFVDDIRKRMSTAWVDLVPPYHNFNHGTDVLLQVAQYALVFGAAELLTPLDVLGLGVAALGHDVSHPGLNNAFQVNSASELALRYADVAVLEAHSAAVVGTLVRDRQLLLGLSDKDFRRCRLIICASILGTDMSTHFKTMERLTKFNDAAPWTATAAAPRSGTRSRPRSASDKEALLGLPISPNCNRASTSQAGCSIGFSDFIVKPLFCQVRKRRTKLMDQGNLAAGLNSTKKKRAFGDSFHKRSHRPRPWAMGHMGSVSHSVSHGLGALSRLGGFGHGGDEKHDHDDVEEGKASLLPLETDRGDDGSDAGAWAAFDACLDGLAKLYHTNQIQTLFFVMTILTLVGNSIRHAYLRPRADFGVDVTLTALMESSSARGTTRTARAVRLIRFMRFVRLVRMAKLMKFLDCFSDAKEEDASEAAQMLLVVLVVLLVTPYLDAEPNAYKPQREILEAMGNMTHAQRSAFVDHSYARRFDVLYLRIAGYDYVPKKDHVLDNLRYGETVIQSRRQVVKLEAFYDLLLIIFISLLVVVSSWSFNEVAEDIVVRPVADMLRVVSKVGRSLDMLKRDAQQAEYETDFLEHSIGKISELLRLGFGTTDALLGDGGGATLAVEGATAIESVRIQAAFAALDRYRGGEARNAANSFLLVWRSRKSELEAPEVAAAPAGDRPGWGGLSYDDLPEVSCCDAAFKALVRTALDVAHVNAVSPEHKELVSALAACDFRGSEDDDPHRNSKLRRAVSGIAQRLSTETKRAGLSFHAPSRARHAAISRVVAKMDKYGTAIVFASGLHFGHAIENRPAGSAGDDYADCTFMSPHVNLAARLELAASAVYGVTMLMSGPFATRATVRQIDRAKLKGADLRADASTTLHTYDFLPAEPERWLEAQGVLGHSELTALFDFDSKGDCDAYLASFSRGRAAYLEGNWALAYDLLQPLMERQSDDAPLSAVVNFMASNGNICPPDWRGYRNL
ncbi:calmodulin-dependent cyclic-nucleotide phosphodiesterase [Aureococcus anophagefferens]|nr:calmodulin-dependent cyclic-nucleotide phosphodiesterase [Aureococcus anophagefferens]